MSEAKEIVGSTSNTIIGCWLHRLLGTETDLKRLETITRLLAERQAKLRELERKESG